MRSPLVVPDASDPAHLVVVGQTRVLPGVVQALAATRSHAHVTNRDTGLPIIGVCDPASPSEQAFYATSDWPQGVRVAGDYTHVIDGAMGLRIDYVTDATAPAEDDFHSTLGGSVGVAVPEDYT